MRLWVVSFPPATETRPAGPTLTWLRGARATRIVSRRQDAQAGEGGEHALR